MARRTKIIELGREVEFASMTSREVKSGTIIHAEPLLFSMPDRSTFSECLYRVQMDNKRGAFGASVQFITAGQIKRVMPLARAA